jgi:hypothetical protein
MGKKTVIVNPPKQWWPGDKRVEEFMKPVSEAIKKYHKWPSSEYTDIYNRAYEAVYDAINGKAVGGSLWSYDAMIKSYTAGSKSRDKQIEELKSREAAYFVLRLDKDPHALKALETYQESVKEDNPELAEDLLKVLSKNRGIQNRRMTGETP